nr:MAG TPA: hypothetical protein [Caudoviricetes sp.]
MIKEERKGAKTGKKRPFLSLFRSKLLNFNTIKGQIIGPNNVQKSPILTINRTL